MGAVLSTMQVPENKLTLLSFEANALSIEPSQQSCVVLFQDRSHVDQAVLKLAMQLRMSLNFVFVCVFVIFFLLAVEEEFFGGRWEETHKCSRHTEKKNDLSSTE